MDIDIDISMPVSASSACPGGRAACTRGCRPRAAPPPPSPRWPGGRPRSQGWLHSRILLWLHCSCQFLLLNDSNLPTSPSTSCKLTILKWRKNWMRAETIFLFIFCFIELDMRHLENTSFLYQVDCDVVYHTKIYLDYLVRDKRIDTIG